MTPCPTRVGAVMKSHERVVEHRAGLLCEEEDKEGHVEVNGEA